MAYTYIENKTFNKENMAVYDKFWDGEQSGYRLLPHEKYVLQDITEDPYPKLILDKNNGLTIDDNGNVIEIMVVHYYRDVHVPLRSKNAIKNYVAVDENLVPYPEEQIF